MAASTSTTPITIKDIEDMEARGIICEIVNGQLVQTSEENTRAKLKDYLRTGVRQVWHVYPETQEVVVYSADGTVHTYDVGQTIPGADVLPGFVLPVADLFEV